jgi:hypothetical protein
VQSKVSAKKMLPRLYFIFRFMILGKMDVPYIYTLEFL